MKLVIGLMAFITIFFMSFTGYSQRHHKACTFKKSLNNYKPFSSADSNVIIVNYDSADSKIWGGDYLPLQTQLMNVNYNANDSSLVNQNVVKYFSVAFDSVIDPYKGIAYPPDSLGGIIVDTIIIPLVQVNHSGNNDTLEVQLNSVDSYGYPQTVVLQDRILISKLLDSNNSSSIINYIKVPENYQLISGTKFAVTIKYSGNKEDSCWFIYGCGTFTGICDSNGPYTLAQPSNFSKILTSKESFNANSFVLYNQSQASGLYPTDSGVELFEDCNNDSTFTPGVDGVSYFQNIDVFAMVSTLPLGVEVITPNLLSVGQNDPNPFNQTTVITYNLTNSADVVFSVYDMAGRKIMENAYTEAAPGQHAITLGANKFSAGIYFYSFNVNGNVITKKMVITE